MPYLIRIQPAVANLLSPLHREPPAPNRRCEQQLELLKQPNPIEASLLPQLFSLFIEMPHLHRCCPSPSLRLKPRLLQFGWLFHWLPPEYGATRPMKLLRLNFDRLYPPLNSDLARVLLERRMQYALAS